MIPVTTSSRFMSLIQSALCKHQKSANHNAMTDSSSFTPEPAPRAMPKRSFASLRAIGALILREMSSTYGNSPGGYMWAILEPVAGVTLLSLVFAAAFDGPPLGISFPVFYATGMMPFLLFTGVQSKVALALMYSKQLLAYPTVTFVDAILARFILNMITELLVAYIVLAGSLLLFENRVHADLPTIALAFGLTGFLALGIGTLNCFLFSRFPPMQQAWSIIMRPMFIISGVFILFETLPEPYASWLWWNPLVHLIGLMRRGFYNTYDASYVSVTYLCIVSLGCMALGLVFLRRYYRDFLNNS